MFQPSINQEFVFDNIKLTIKREDLIHPYVSGNKFRKLKYNLLEANKLNHHTLLTFGGAYSNHLLAVAFAAHQNNFNSIGVVRADEITKEQIDQNPTLSKCVLYGMQLFFVTREQYRDKSSETFFNDLKIKFGDFFLIPEGGSNENAVLGCQEILTEEDQQFNIVCCAVGTGGTISGLIRSSVKNQLILGFPALKGDFLDREIRNFVEKSDNWRLIHDYHFGGYAKLNDDYIQWLNDFYDETKIPLDPIYTGKMMFGVIDMIKHQKIEKNQSILCIHTGGLQGIKGINQKLKAKNKSVLRYEKDIDFI